MPKKAVIKYCPHTKTDKFGTYAELTNKNTAARLSGSRFQDHLYNERIHTSPCVCEFCIILKDGSLVSEDKDNILENMLLVENTVDRHPHLNTVETNNDEINLTLPESNVNPLTFSGGIKIIKKECEKSGTQVKEAIEVVEKQHDEKKQEIFQLKLKQEILKKKIQNYKNLYSTFIDKCSFKDSKPKKKAKKYEEIVRNVNELVETIECFKKNFVKGRISSFICETRGSDVENEEIKKRINETELLLTKLFGTEDISKIYKLLILKSEEGQKIIEKKTAKIHKAIEEKNFKKKKVLLPAWEALSIKYKYKIGDEAWGHFRDDLEIENTLYSILHARKVLEKYLNLFIAPKFCGISVKKAVEEIIKNEELKEKEKVLFKLSVDGVKVTDEVYFEIASITLLGRPNSVFNTYPLAILRGKETHYLLNQILTPIVAEANEVQNVLEHEIFFFYVFDLQATAYSLGLQECYNPTKKYFCCWCYATKDEAKKKTKFKIERDLKKFAIEILKAFKYDPGFHEWKTKVDEQNFSKTHFGFVRLPLLNNIFLVFPCLLHLIFRIFDSMLIRLETLAKKQFDRDQYNEQYLSKIKSFKFPIKVDPNDKATGVKAQKRKIMNFFKGEDYDKINSQNIYSLIEYIFSY